MEFDVETSELQELSDLLMDPQFYAGDPHPVLARLRHERPVLYNERHGFWALTRHHDVHEVSRDSERFVSGYGVLKVGLTEHRQIPPGSLLTADPPDHTYYRRILLDAFTPSKIRALEPAVRDRATRLLEGIGPDGVTEFVSTVAVPFPLVVLADLMGLPADDWEDYCAWMDAAVRTSNPDPDPADVSAVGEMRTFLLEQVGAQRGTSAPGAIGMLADHRDDRGELSQGELLMFLLQLFIAGNETTRSTLAGGMVAFAENPDQWARLRAHRELVPRAVEEILRWTTAVTHFFRTAAEPCEIDGTAIAAGDRVLMSYTSANRDEEVFGHSAAVFDAGRDSGSQVSFGFGGHFCLGAALARLELRVMLEELLDRYESIELAGDVVRLPNITIAGFERVELRLT